MVSSGGEFAAHDVSDYANTLLFVEDGFPSWHFAKTIGNSVIHKFRLVAGRLELGGLARVSAVAMAVSALAIPDGFACLDIGRFLHDRSGECGNRFIG